MFGLNMGPQQAMEAKQLTKQKPQPEHLVPRLPACLQTQLTILGLWPRIVRAKLTERIKS